MGLARGECDWYLVFLLTRFRVDPSNNRSGIGVGSSESCSLLRTANGRALSEMAAEVREKRKEFGVREVEFSLITGSALPFFFQQPLKSASLEWLPSSFPWALQ